jgi:hypothetical protein
VSPTGCFVSSDNESLSGLSQRAVEAAAKLTSSSSFAPFCHGQSAGMWLRSVLTERRSRTSASRIVRRDCSRVSTAEMHRRQIHVFHGWLPPLSAALTAF